MSTPDAIVRFIVDGGVPTMLGLGVALRWQIHPAWALRNTKVDILFGRSPTDEFEAIGTVETDVEFMDPQQRRIDNQTANTWYALKVTDKDNGDYSYTQATPVGTSLRKREWLIGKEIVRQEYTRLVRRRAGVRGWLLRRRITGQTCTYCVAPETGQVTRADCSYCYGTGFVGGYYPQQECWMEMNPDVVLRRLDPEQGMLADYQKTFRCLAYPTPHPNDYWVSAKSGLVYRIKENISVQAAIEEEPLVLRGDWYVEQSNNVIYKFPIAET